MMDPIKLAETIEARYLKYLSTTFYFRDPELRASFEAALKSGRLCKGPYLEATPLFKKTRSPGELFAEMLDFQPDSAFLAAFGGNRVLYKHQEEAVLLSHGQRNVIVATGTGSGKTEAFLFPILLHLYCEFRAGTLEPGVRALVLYPMNALASDQRDRLGEICRQLQEGNSSFRFTFGQYTGETPEDKRDARRRAEEQKRHRRPGELVFRSEMRSSPPHILLTNYSMLEYLLLRPDDSPLFDGGRGRHWKFIVLDEAHQYRGARGIEMAMLLRRLKRRIVEGGRADPFSCIATSATLMGGESDKASVARFASSLFGEPFAAGDVILGETERIAVRAVTTFSADEYEALDSLVRNSGAGTQVRLDQIARDHGLDIGGWGETPQKVGALLLQDARVLRLFNLISRSPRDIGQIADEIFPEAHPDSRAAALSALVDLVAFAQDPVSRSCLLNARYHFFLRGLEGAFVSYCPRKTVQLERSKIETDAMSFEVALCRECGQHYFVGKRGVVQGKLGEAVRDPGQEDFGATFYRPIDSNDAEAETDVQTQGGAQQVYHLCIRCGEIARRQPSCGHAEIQRVVREPAPEDGERADQAARCGVCGYSGAGRDPVREIVHGTDGPHAVIATTLFRSLPEDRRKVLAFADGRQEAAFFAWYLEESYRGILVRNLILQTLKRLGPHAPDGLSLRELSSSLGELIREREICPPAAGNLEIRREAWHSLYAEFLTDEPRLSLEGVGLARWTIHWPNWFQSPAVLLKAPLSLNDSEARELVFLLLDTMRSDRAVEICTADGVSLPWSELGIRSYQTRFRIGPPGGRGDTKSWDGKGSRRARLLARLLSGSRIDPESIQQAVSILRAIWEAMILCDETAPSREDRLLLSIDDARRLNPDWWRLRPIDPDQEIFQCDTCGRLQAVSIRGICPRHLCPGLLKKIKVKYDDNHYRSLYEEELPGRLAVEEHTAQLEYEKAREFQRLFKEGEINVLSCSTTFELGVDLGDLDVAFLRNVPPEAFNYAQRVGRVGRRSGHPGFAITYSRRSPHDLYHFEEPQRLLAGKVKPPSFCLFNDRIILRHITATALSLFFRQHKERFGTVECFCRDMEKPAVTADVRQFLLDRKKELEGSLEAIVPEEAEASIGLADETWINKVSGQDSRLALTESEVSSDFKIIKQLRLESFERGDDRSVAWAGARMKTIAQEDVLSFLSRKAAIPKYGFPVDVVELDTQRATATAAAAEVSLQRDLTIAVSEFAPTSKVIANKRVWTSYALKRVAEREWDRWFYSRCPLHGSFERRRSEAEIKSVNKCCDKMKTYQYVEPRFGFLTNRDKSEAPTGRPVKTFTTRPYFAGWKDKEGEVMDFRALHLTKASPGYMIVLCEGRGGGGFFICSKCGAGFRKAGEFQRGHKTPYGVACQTRPEALRPAVSLGHEIISDVVKLQFILPHDAPADSTWLAFSVAFALVEGTAEVLDVPSVDLNATVAYSGAAGLLPPIILYDTVPGGAGLVARLHDKDRLVACIEAGQKRLAGCKGCGEESSCYSCLRSYRNQFAHQFLCRGAADRYLQRVLAAIG